MMLKPGNIVSASLKALLLLPLLLNSCRQGDYARFGGYAQGGTWVVKADLSDVQLLIPDGKGGQRRVDGRKEQMQLIQGRIDAILEEIDTTLSGYNKNSQLSRFNAGEPVEPSAMFKQMYAHAYRFWEETGGALDCAAGPLFDIWGFGFRNDSLPSDDRIRETMARCGMGLSGPELPASMELPTAGDEQGIILNFNAIAQGYTCDKVAEYLHGIGVRNMLVDIGEIYCEGVNPQGRPWRVGVDRPVDGNNNPGADLDGIWESSGATGQGVVTSGNYRKFYVKDGVKYSHTIDPRTGRPVQHNLLSATIVAPTAMEADAYATYCMVIGREAAEAFILSRTDIEGYLISGTDAGMSEWASPGFNILRN